MMLFDTDHLTILQYEGGTRRNQLLSRMALSLETEFSAPIIAIEQHMRGWLASIAKERLARRQVPSYRDLADLFDFYSDFDIAPFDDAAADQFEQFNKIRISTSDRKIAAIAIVNNALLLTANRRDFEKIPGLRFENWLD